MNLSEVPIVQSEGAQCYEFGAFARPDGQHEERVLMRTSEFACTAHGQFDSGCPACIDAARGLAPDYQGPIEHLRRSRGIEVTAG